MAARGTASCTTCSGFLPSVGPSYMVNNLSGQPLHDSFGTTYNELGEENPNHLLAERLDIRM